MTENSPSLEGARPDDNRSGSIAAGSGDFVWEGEGSVPVISVAPKIIVVESPNDPSGTSPPGRTAPGEAEESGEDSAEWKRKASGRRLRAVPGASESGDVPAPDDYEPDFTALRLPDWTPEFDQSHPVLASKGWLPRWKKLDHRWRLLLAAGGVIAGVLALSIAAVLWYRKDIDRAMKSAQSAAVDDPEALHAHAAQSAKETLADVRSVVTGFFNARTPEGKAAIIRGGHALLPAMQAYYALRPDEPGEIQFTGTIKRVPDDSRLFFFVSGSDAGKVPFEVVVESTGDGMKLDWRYLTGSGEMDWQQWIRERPAVPVRLRAVATPDNYYTGEFANAQDWICIRVTNLARTATAWAYAPRVSNTAIALAGIFAGQRTDLRLQGLFEFPRGKPGNRAEVLLTPQVFLRSVDNRGWLDRSPELGYPPDSNDPQKEKPQ
jgi:hypothetical protein